MNKHDKHPDEHLVQVFSTPSAEIAEIVRNALEEEGIRCAIGNEHQAALTGLGDMLEVEVYVAEHDVAKARELIESHIK